MSTLNTTNSANGRGSESWSRSWTHITVDRRSRGYCRVTFEHPPINTITATTVAELAELVGLIEQDPDLNVVVFDSANPDFYLAHYDTEHDPSRTAALPLGPTGMHAWLDLLVRLSRAPLVSIAAIRGCARGAGSEFVLACDLRFASRENTLLGQFEVGTGLVPGGGPMARLSRLVGRGRALEILLVADDFDGPRAERYGYVNRVIADDRLDNEVDAMALRLARFDREALARTKSYVDPVTLPADSEFPSALADFFELSGRPAQQARFARLEALGLNVDSELERSLGRRVVDAPRRLSPGLDQNGAYDPKPPGAYVLHRNPDDIQPVAVLKLDHLAHSARNQVDDSIQKTSSVRYVPTSSVCPARGACRCGANRGTAVNCAIER